MGLVTVEDTITIHPEPDDIDALCGGKPAGAYSIVTGIAMGTCTEASCGMALLRETFRVYGDIYFYTGTYSYKGRKPMDTSVVDPSSALRHEYREHIVPATNAAVKELAKVENTPFKSLAECEKKRRKAEKRAMNAFRDVLRATKGF